MLLTFIITSLIIVITIAIIVAATLYAVQSQNSTRKTKLLLETFPPISI